MNGCSLLIIYFQCEKNIDFHICNYNQCEKKCPPALVILTIDIHVNKYDLKNIIHTYAHTHIK